MPKQDFYLRAATSSTRGVTIGPGTKPIRVRLHIAYEAGIAASGIPIVEVEQTDHPGINRRGVYVGLRDTTHGSYTPVLQIVAQCEPGEDVRPDLEAPGTYLVLPDRRIVLLDEAMRALEQAFPKA